MHSLSLFPAASPENGHELLLDEKFLRDCVELYSAPTKTVETNGLDFPIRHLNIVDPLKHSNNLGKSVTKGTFIDYNFHNHCISFIYFIYF